MSAPIFTDEQYAVVAARDAEIARQDAEVAALTERYVPLVEENERLRAAARAVVEADVQSGASNRSAYLSHGMLCDTQTSNGKRDKLPCDCGLSEYDAAFQALRAALSSTRGGGADE